MPTELPLPRLVITGNDAQGRSRIVSDGPPHRVRSSKDRPGYRVSNLWALHGAPAPLDDPDRVAEVQGLMPPRAGSVIRIIDYPPEPKDTAALQKMFDGMFARMFPDGHHRPESPAHPGIHATETVDYVIVLKGEIWAVMDEGETLLCQGDIIIQRGTSHAWANRSNEFARLAIVLIDGKR